MYYWADGSEMAHTGPVDRQNVPLDAVPASVQGAVIAAENEAFLSDCGISPPGMARALYAMATGGRVQGGSTITQQYVKNAYLDQRQSLTRKFTEILMAVRLTRQLSKQQILERYLNTSWFGRGVFGIERAAQVYYRKHVRDLDPSQGAFVASLLNGAGLYDPALGPANRTRAVARWNWTLDRMVATGRLTAHERAGYTRFPEPTAPVHQDGLGGQNGYLVDLARHYLQKNAGISPTDLEHGGYQVRTTFDKARTAALAEAVRTASARQDPSGRLRTGAASVGTDGRIIALYGGPDYHTQRFDNADADAAQAGSAFAPLVYATALTHGVRRHHGDAHRTPVTPDTRYNGDDAIAVTTPEGLYRDRDGLLYRTPNDGRKSWGSITLKTAVEQSVNAPIAQLGIDTGLDRVRETAIRLGLLPTSLGSRTPGFPLGNSTPSAIRMASAYATFASDGLHTDPHSVLAVTRDSQSVDLHLPPTTRVLSPQVASQVHDALIGTVEEGTATDADTPGATVAGKTGTVRGNTAGWFIGYTTSLSTAVTVFRTDPNTRAPQTLDGQPDPARCETSTDMPIDIWNTYTGADEPGIPSPPQAAAPPRS